jgi:hypothetical protein
MNISDGKKISERDFKGRKAVQQEWTSNSMLFLLRMTLMGLGGYIKHRQAEAAHHNNAEALRYARSKLFPPEVFVFPDAHELKAQLFSPVKKLNQDDSDSLPSSNLTGNDSRTSQLVGPPTSTPSPKHSRSTVTYQRSNWLAVPCIRFTRNDEALAIWVDSVGSLVEMCNVPVLPLIHRALYCLEVLISSGNVASLPVHIWFKALDELASKLPMNLLSATNKLQGLSHVEIQETCFRCCNLIFHLLVMHIWELRKTEHFMAMFIRAISAMATNASVCPKDSTAHEDMLGMIIALLRLLRLPEQQQVLSAGDFAITKLAKTEKFQTESTGHSSENNGGGFLGILQWMITPAPSQPPILISEQTHSGQTTESEIKDCVDTTGPIPLATLDHDGLLLLLTWKSICTVYPHIPMLIRTWDAQYYRSLQSSMELVDLIKARGECLAIGSPKGTMSALSAAKLSITTPAEEAPQPLVTTVPVESLNSSCEITAEPMAPKTPATKSNHRASTLGLASPIQIV